MYKFLSFIQPKQEHSSNLYFFMIKPLLSNTIHLYNNLKSGAVDNKLISTTVIYVIIFWCVCNQQTNFHKNSIYMLPES